ncbi:uncharacterized protein LOC130944680 isoform X1 [Arachis stenosperma]|uniref:uncharacterized protein LOC130944680 isoform X1 n=2 Tax=Arachis stenosperma TaxID=217475 RepID=UPI0025ABD76B|nr:uncharacterized protein LOC130944680 isoform X1 [Arachis stenosperma]XP_057729110.1 uncharacterized protein LOC130944680 isoform X1 [Arachis stenosperma]XP_057729111.1 uncharacterized protein LOC130944680 isoform X1 [Arachis stenosperma]XP_057729112.1 uncharacterized protein LOC130944680 isoform X1 [Arachis stenosperma]XP_057729113.1 uncharacterized protein LOC130944680 isoform X1 [Arachis stenosperma]XP_057729114.1 uncharacterized protein LOC130944680 isoform X1 [Arachis stenosperma]
MLIQSSLLSSVEAGSCYVTDDGKDILCDRMPSGQTWQAYMKCSNYPLNWCGKAEQTKEDRRNADNPCNSNCLSGLGQPSTASIMTDNTAPNMVYRRKKLRKGLNAPLSNCRSVISSSVRLSSAEDRPGSFQVKDHSEMIRNLVVSSVLLDGVVKDNIQKSLGIDSVNDSCSSSKSNMELVSDSVETEIDEPGECSSSSAIVLDVTREAKTEKDSCMNILRSYGLRGDCFADNAASLETVVTAGNICCSRLCKTCGRLDSSLNMLLCDHCEDAYHPTCYNPRFKKLPTDEWFCHSCLTKSHKILRETIIKSPGIHNELGKCRTASVKAELNPILLMLRETEPYTTKVRVGKGFQAEVLGWLGPQGSDEDELPEPLEINHSEFSTLQARNPRNPTRLGSIGNWLQCQEIINRDNGTVCGKWRRAPLFEVQADDWECFCGIHWDPYHADCAVPQELETDQVLKQLKYIEMLRPQLTAKQRKSDCNSSGD